MYVLYIIQLHVFIIIYYSKNIIIIMYIIIFTNLVLKIKPLAFVLNTGIVLFIDAIYCISITFRRITLLSCIRRCHWCDMSRMAP